MTETTGAVQNADNAGGARSAPRMDAAEQRAAWRRNIAKWALEGIARLLLQAVQDGKNRRQRDLEPEKLRDQFDAVLDGLDESRLKEMEHAAARLPEDHRITREGGCVVAEGSVYRLVRDCNGSHRLESWTPAGENTGSWTNVNWIYDLDVDATIGWLNAVSRRTRLHVPTVWTGDKSQKIKQGAAADPESVGRLGKI